MRYGLYSYGGSVLYRKDTRNHWACSELAFCWYSVSKQKLVRLHFNRGCEMSSVFETCGDWGYFGRCLGIINAIPCHTNDGKFELRKWWVSSLSIGSALKLIKNIQVPLPTKF